MHRIQILRMQKFEVISLFFFIHYDIIVLICLYIYNIDYIT